MVWKTLGEACTPEDGRFPLGRGGVLVARVKGIKPDEGSVVWWHTGIGVLRLRGGVLFFKCKHALVPHSIKSTDVTCQLS